MKLVSSISSLCFFFFGGDIFLVGWDFLFVWGCFRFSSSVCFLLAALFRGVGWTSIGWSLCSFVLTMYLSFVLAYKFWLGNGSYQDIVSKEKKTIGKLGDKWHWGIEDKIHVRISKTQRRGELKFTQIMDV